VKFLGERNHFLTFLLDSSELLLRNVGLSGWLLLLFAS